MVNFDRLFLATLGLGLLAGSAARAQTGIGTGSTAPRTMLDVNGAIAVTETTAAVSGNAATVPTGYSLVRLTGTATATVALTGASAPAPVAGQQLVIYNTTAFPATFGGQTIPAASALAFVYSNGGWQGSAGGANGLTASNGLTKTGNNVVLGGALTQATSVSGISSTNTLSFSSPTAADAAITVGNTSAGAGRVQLGNANHGIQRDLTGSTNGATNDVAVYTSAASVHLVANPNTTGNTSLPLGQLTLTPAGRVGLGTTAPSAKLHMVTTGGTGGADDDLNLDSYSGTGVDGGNIIFRHSRGTLAAPANLASGDLAFALDARPYYNGAFQGPSSFLYSNYVGSGTSNLTNLRLGTSGTERVRISETGNVGIGLTAPITDLDVNGTGLFRNGGVSNATTGNEQLLFGYAGANNYQHAIRSRHNDSAQNGNALDFYLWNYGTDAATAIGTKQVMTLDGNGNVGIGTTVPAEKLEVNGNIRLGSEPASFATGWGSYLEFDGNGVATDVIGLARYNTAANNTELRMVVGDDPNGPGGAATDRFVLGTANVSTPGQLGNSTFTPKFYVYSSGATGIGIDPAATNLLDVAGTAGTSNVRMASLGGTGTRVVQAAADGTLSTTTAASLVAGNLTASNGLTKTGNDVALGGALTQATTLNASSFPLAVTGLNNTSATFGTGGGIVLGSTLSSAGSTGVQRLEFTSNSDPNAAIGHTTRAEGSATEINDLYLYSGDNVDNTYGPDRIRLVAPNILFQSINASGGVNTLANAESNTNTTTNLFIGSNGYVGLGTATPATKLHVVTPNGGGQGEDDYIYDSYSGTNPSASGIYYRHARGTQAAPANLANGDLIYTQSGQGYINGGFAQTTFFDSYYTGSGTTNASFMRFGTSNAERLRISEAGNVGIGTTAPFAPLQFSNGLANRKVVLYDATNSATVTNDHQFYGLGIQNSTLRYQVEGPNTDHVFYSGIDATSSKELMRVTGDGKVGIGTNNPTEALEVDGNIRLGADGGTATGAGNVMEFVGPGLNSDNMGIYRYNTAVDASELRVAFGDNGGTVDRFVLGMASNGVVGTIASTPWTPVTSFYTDGRLGVGMGATAPSAALQVNGSVKAGTDATGNARLTPSGTSNAGYLEIYKGNGTTRLGYIGYNNTQMTYVAENGAQHIFSGGNVGINTAAPSSLLTMNTTTVNQIGGNLAMNDVSKLYMVPQLGAGGYNSISQNGDMGFFFPNASGNIITAPSNSRGLVLAPWTANTSGLKIAETGNVGIGTATPINTLQLDNGAANSGTSFLINNNGPATSGALPFGTANRDGIQAIVAGTALNSELYIQRSSTNSNMYLSKNSALGTVTNGDYVDFFLNGSIQGSIKLNGTSGVTFNTTSDIRLKENIRPTAYGLADVMKVQVRDYNYKTDKATPQTGFIAQQLYDVFPVAVTKGGDDAQTKPWTVDYSKLTPLLTKAIQEEQAEIEALKAANAKLVAENAALKAGLDGKASASTLDDMQAALQALRAEVQTLQAAGPTARAK